MTDVKLSVQIHPEDGYEWSTILLARGNSDGTLELLTRAWERLLGYGRRELDGKVLSSLMATERGEETGEPARAIAAIFDQRSMASVDVTLRCRAGARKRVTLHRRLDARGTVHIVGEVRAGAAPAHRPAGGAPANRRSAAPPPSP